MNPVPVADHIAYIRDVLARGNQMKALRALAALEASHERLLEVCKEAADELERMDAFDDTFGSRNVAAKCRAEIKNAEGRSG